MGSSDRRPSAALVDQLADHPDQFEFVQAVRLLEQMVLRGGGGDGAGSAQAVGYDHAPGREVARFRALPSLAFPGSPIVSLKHAPKDRQVGFATPAELVVSFMGLTGPTGVLPQHYTSLLLEQLREGETAFRDFLDMFNHRLISLFYRASTKYQASCLVAENRVRSDFEDDLFTGAIRSLAGFGTAGLNERLEICDDVFIFFAGHFSHTPRNAVSLEQMTRYLLSMSARLIQYQGQWLYLDEEDQSRLPGPGEANGLGNQLGVGVVVGERVWSIQSKFRIRVGPVGYADFVRLMPVGDLLRPLCQFTRAYAGPEFDFDVQVVLQAEDVPLCRLDGDVETRLGWNTWLFCGSYPHDAEDVVFRLPDV